MTPQDVRALLGDPEEADDDTAEDGLLLVYPSRGIEYLSFDREEGLRLTSIELNETADPTIWGQRLFEIGRREIERMLNERGGYLALDEIQPSDNEQVHWSADGFGLSFYFGRNDELQEVAISALIGLDDEVQWPNLKT